MGDKSFSMNQGLRFGNVLFVIGLIFVAFNLRSSITAVGPLISSIRTDTGMSNTSIGMITTLPLIAFGLFSTIAPRFGRKFGNETVVFVALLILTMGILFRSTGMVITLFIGTALLGLGIAICNVLIPGIVKDKYPEKVGLMTGMYTTSMSVMAALASGVSIPLAHGFNLGWEKALAVWAIMSGFAVILWLPQLRKQNKAIKVPTLAKSSIWRSPLAWQVTLFMGFQSSIFYCIIAWLPEILTSRGVDIPTAGWLLTFMQFASLPATLLIPVLASRLRSQKIIVVGITVLYLVGFTGLYFGGNLVVITFYMLLFGVAQGSAISLSLTLFGLRTENAHDAANLSGMAQSGGYLLASISPLFMGLLFDTFHTWTPALLVFLFLTIAMVIAGIGAARNQYIFHKEPIKLRA